MSRGQLSLWAQSMDDVSPAHVEVDGRPIPPEEELTRHDVTRQIGEISLNHKPRHEGVHSTVYLADTRFLIELVPEKPDDKGRRAPVSAVGELPSDAGIEWADRAATELLAFAEQAGRTLDEPTRMAARNAFRSLLASSGGAALTTRWAVAAGVVLVAALVWWFAASFFVERGLK